MARYRTMASNGTTLFSAVQSDPEIIPVGGLWFEKEPNEYDNFGSQQKKVTRRPINASRMAKKPEIVGEDPGLGFNQDFTATNMAEDLKGFLFADYRTKSEVVTTGVAADGYVVTAGGDAFDTGALIYAKGAINAANNGLRVLTADGSPTKINVAGLIVAAGDEVIVSRVGQQFATGDFKIDASGPLPIATTTAFDLTTLGLIPGEIVYLGGDLPTQRFDTAANAGWLRVYSVAAHTIVFDKTDAPFVTDPGAGKNIRLFFGRVLKNEADPLLQQTYYYAHRRQLGRSESGGTVESEVTLGSVANKITIKAPEEDKLTTDVEYMGRTYLQFENDALVDPAGQFVPVFSEDAINSTKDARRLRISAYTTDNGVNTSTPEPLFSGFTELEMTIDNNVSANKAITKFGTFAHTPGNFDFKGSLTAYFSGIRSIKAIKDNRDLTFLFTTFKNNKGVAFDCPMIGLDTDGLDIEMNSPITLDIDMESATGKTYNPAMDHAILVTFFDFLPNAARN